MTEPRLPMTDDSGAMLKRIHELGGASETLFERLYKSLGQRKQRAESARILAEHFEQMEFRTRALRRVIEEQSIEVERLHAILASISEGIIMQDTEGRLVMMNNAAYEMLGTERNFWKSELGVLFAARKDWPTLNSELAPIGEALRAEIRGRVLSAQIAAITDQNDTRIGTMMILRDMTKDTLEERLKNSLVTHISHELITPLAPLRLASEILKNTPEGEAPNRRMLELIGRNVDILDRMVTEMLDMSAMTSGEFTIQREPVQLETMLWEIVESFTTDIQAAELELTVMLRQSDRLLLQADQKHLRWAISNLVRNAVQYNEPGQKIILAAGLERERKNRAFVMVEDTGVGIVPDELPKIFDLFFRGAPRTRSGKRLDPRGLGQGLFVARTIASAHGGQLSVDSTPHQGSIFTLSLPLDVPATLPA